MSEETLTQTPQVLDPPYSHHLRVIGRAIELKDLSVDEHA